MTQLTWTGWPEQIEIKCPKCGGRATYEDPFTFSPIDRSKRRPRPTRLHLEDLETPLTMPPEPPEELPDDTHHWGEWMVVEKFPGFVPWDPPAGPEQELSFPEAREGSGHYAYMKRGAYRCVVCNDTGGRPLAWPADAYHQWEMDGNLLWAVSRDHALAIREFIASGVRKPSGDFSPLLKQIPRAFLKPEAREAILKRIDASCAEN